MKLNDLWTVGGGENSKEAGFQKNRNSREKETFYQTILDIPSNPKEPWDIEMDYDDSLTPEILTEQLPDNESSEMEVRNHAVDGAVPSEVISSQDLKPNVAEPDLELLAVLLKNPELVYALTSSQAGNLPAEETVKLLDMIKAGGSRNMGSANRMENTVEKVEVSLPSPTPSSNAGTVRDLGSFCCCCKSTCKNVAYFLCLTDYFPFRIKYGEQIAPLFVCSFISGQYKFPQPMWLQQSHQRLLGLPPPLIFMRNRVSHDHTYFKFPTR